MQRLRRRGTLGPYLACLLALWTVGCGGGAPAPTPPTPNPAQPSPSQPQPPIDPRPTTWDPATQGLPHLVTAQYLDLDGIARISRFRSGEGHSYTDAFEQCRSMKHYFEPRVPAASDQIRVYSPVDGTVTRTLEEWAGLQVHITVTEYPAFDIILFHVAPTTTLEVGTPLSAGQPIGRHIGAQTMSDVAVGVRTPHGYQLVSWFDVLDDRVFGAYVARGLTLRSDAIISREDRDARPLACSGEQFADKGTLPNWVVLR